MKDGDHYQAEADLRSLIEAEKIKKDSQRHKAAMGKHKELSAALNNIGTNKATK